MAAASADVRDSAKGGKVVALQDASNLSRCLSRHRLIEKTGRLRILAEILPITAWYDLFLNGFPRPQGIDEIFKSSKIHRQPNHPDEGSHRLWMIRPQ